MGIAHRQTVVEPGHGPARLEVFDLLSRSQRGAILIVIDGCRHDGLRQAATPHIDSLIARGSCTFEATSVMPCVTLPCHASIFHGVSPGRHGITTNTWTPMARPVPSIVDLAHDSGLRTASFYNWEPLRDMARPGSLEFSLMRGALKTPEDDLPIAGAAANHLAGEGPDFCFIYLGMVDIIGHRHGWMSPSYIRQIEIADEAVGIVLESLKRPGLDGRYSVILLSDHGGHENTHGTDLPEDMTIPWIAAGPGIRGGHEIQRSVNIVDTAPTLARILGLSMHEEWEGQPVDEIFDASSICKP